MIRAIRTHGITLTFAAIASSVGSASAAPIDNSEWIRMSAQAAAGKAVPVVVDVTSVSLMELKHQLDKVSSRGASYAAALMSELGEEAWPESSEYNPLGQLRTYVSLAGLRYLKNNGSVLAFREGAEWYARSNLHRSAESLAKVDDAAQTAGSVDVVVTLNLEGLEHVYDANGTVGYVVGPMAAASVPDLFKRLISALEGIPAGRAASALKVSAAAATSADASINPELRLRLNKRELVAIAKSGAIRDIRIDADESKPPFVVDADTLAEADAYGYADVVVTLHAAVQQGRLSQVSSDAHWKSVNDTMNSVRANFGGLNGVKNLPALNAMIGRVSLSELRSLASSIDRRLAKISMRKSFGQPALNTSNQLLLTSKIWNYGISGAGAKVVVMDTGVQSAHSFLRGLNGATRVTRQRCFGTTDPAKSLQSVCPLPQDASFNSSSPASGEAFIANCPYATASHCWHGTAVAGIAAGGTGMETYNPNGPGGINKSVSFASDIWSYNIYSKKGTSTISGQSWDVLEALNDVLMNTAATSPPANPANPIVVNISLAGSDFSQTCSGTSSGVPSGDSGAYDAAQAAINSLYSRGVAVVAPTGNAGQTNKTAFPSCLAKVVKVGATVVEPVSALEVSATKTASYSNLPDPAKFPGDYIWMVPGGGFVHPIPPASLVLRNLTLPKASSTGVDWYSTNATSFAAPHVSGLFALIKSALPDATVQDIGDYLLGFGRSFSVSGVMSNGTSVYKTYKGIRFLAL